MFPTSLIFREIITFLSTNLTKVMSMKFLRRPQVENLTGLSRSTIYSMVLDGSFPKQIKIGRRAVAWREADIVNWMNNKSDS